jgi:hypothetical protein
MAGTLIVIKWRDVPLQVIARDRRRAHKVLLHPRFQVAADRAAVKAEKRSASDYIEEMRRDSRPCGDDLEAEATAEAARIETAYTREVLARLVASGGVDEPRESTAGTADPAEGTGPAAATGPAEATEA